MHIMERGLYTNGEIGKEGEGYTLMERSGRKADNGEMVGRRERCHLKRLGFIFTFSILRRILAII